MGLVSGTRLGPYEVVASHICTLFDVGNADGVDYLVMEYLEGETLARHAACSGPFRKGVVFT